MKKYILKDTLLKIMERIRDGYKHQSVLRERINENKINNSKLLLYNNTNDYKNTIYLYKNKNVLKEIHKDKIVENYIRKIMTQSINNKVINIQYSGPIFYHTINKVYILLFIYKPQDISTKSILKNMRKTNENILIRLISKLMNNKEDKGGIFNIINNIYGNKEVVIEPIYLTYDYLDSKILSKTISSNIFKYNQYKGLYSNIISKNIPIMNINNIVYNKLYNKKLLYKLLTLTDLNKVLKPSLKVGGVDTNINSMYCIQQLLLYQHIIGYDWVYKGKLAKSDSNARSVYSLKQYGTLTNSYTLQGGLFTTEKAIYSLNRHPSYITKNSNNLINKNGKYNISVTLSHI